MSSEVYPQPYSPEENEIDSFGVYLERISRIPLLSAEEEVVLAKRIEAGLAAEHLLAPSEEGQEALRDDPQRYYRQPLPTEAAFLGDLQTVAVEGRAAKERFVAANLRLAVSEACKLRRSPLSLQERAQAASMGIIRAVEKFDYTKGFKFSTYATWWTRQAMHRASHEMSRTIRLPTHVGEDLKKLRNAQQAYNHPTQQAPTIGELVATTGLDEHRIRALLDWQATVIDVRSLDAPLGDGDLTLGDVVRDAASTDTDALQRLDRRFLMETLETVLSARERMIVDYYFGITREDLTYQQIGDTLGVSRERVRQIMDAALAKLSRHVQDQQLTMASFGDNR